MITKEKLYEAIADKAKQRAVDSLQLLIASANEYLSILDKVTVKEFIERIKGNDLSNVPLGQVLRCNVTDFFNCETKAEVKSHFTIDFIASKIRDNFMEQEVDSYINEIREWGDERERFYKTLNNLNKALHEEKLKSIKLESQVKKHNKIKSKGVNQKNKKKLKKKSGYR